MLKKLTILLLLQAFLIASTGVVVSQLFCNGNLSASGISIKACCQKKNCCEKKTEFLKVKDQFVKAHDLVFDTDQYFSLLYINDFTAVSFDSFVFSAKSFSAFDSSPPMLSVSRNILFCNFLI